MWDIMWKLSWANFMLIMGSIQTYESESDEGETIEEKEADEIF